MVMGDKDVIGYFDYEALDSSIATSIVPPDPHKSVKS